MHLVDLSVGMMGSTPIVGGTIPVAAGLAFAAQLRRENRVVVLFIGEGATEEGVFAEMLNFAALKKLPLLCVCENNLYSVYSPLSVRQAPQRDRVALAAAHGLFARKGDGYQIEEVLALTQEALAHIRQGLGTAFVEFDTYRFREHCGPHFDNHIGYRQEAEAMVWELRCPIRRWEQEQSPEEMSALKEEIAQEIADAFRFAEESPFP